MNMKTIPAGTRSGSGSVANLCACCEDWTLSSACGSTAATWWGIVHSSLPPCLRYRLVHGLPVLTLRPAPSSPLSTHPGLISAACTTGYQGMAWSHAYTSREEHDWQCSSLPSRVMKTDMRLQAGFSHASPHMWLLRPCISARTRRRLQDSASPAHPLTTLQSQHQQQGQLQPKYPVS